MQMIKSYTLLFILLLTMKQYSEVNAQRRHRRQQTEQQNEVVENSKSTQQLLEIETLEIPSQNNLLAEIEKAQQKQQEYEYELQQQQEKVLKLKEQYEHELQEQEKKQQLLEQQRQYEREQEIWRQKQYEYEYENELQQKQQQQNNPIATTYMKDDIDLDYNSAESNFYVHYSDGTYAYGYALPNGNRRFERSYYSNEIQGMFVEGFYTEIRDWGTHSIYELHCYRSGPYGYRPMPVRSLDHAPLVRRNMTLDDNCIEY